MVRIVQYDGVRPRRKKGMVLSGAVKAARRYFAGTDSWRNDSERAAKNGAPSGLYPEVEGKNIYRRPGEFGSR